MIALALAVALVASPAPVEPPQETREMSWILPDGGSPENVTWPQALASQDNLAAVPCGESVWLQVDYYRYDTAAEQALVDSLAADGILTHGEDTKVAWHHRWEQFTAAACEPEPTPTPTPEPTPETTPEPTPEATPTETPAAPVEAAPPAVTILAETGAPAWLLGTLAAIGAALFGAGVYAVRRSVVRS